MYTSSNTFSWDSNTNNNNNSIDFGSLTSINQAYNDDIPGMGLDNGNDIEVVNTNHSMWSWGNQNQPVANSAAIFMSSQQDRISDQNQTNNIISNLYWGSDYESAEQGQQSQNQWRENTKKTNSKMNKLATKKRKTKTINKKFATEFDTSLPNHWNVIKKKKSRKRKDPFSSECFGTIHYKNPRTTNSKSNSTTYKSFSTTSVKYKYMRANPKYTHVIKTRTAQELANADAIRKNRYYLNNYNFTNYIVDNNIIHEGNLLKTSSLTIPKVSVNTERDSDENEIESGINRVNDVEIESIHSVESDSDNIEVDIDINNNVEMNENCWLEVTDKDMEQDEVVNQENKLYMNAQDLTKEEKEKEYPGNIAIDEISKYQTNGKLLIEKDEFEGFVGNIIYNNNTYSKDVTIQSNAMHALQEAAEDHIVRLFEYANAMAINSERQNVNETDIQVVIQLLKKRPQKLQLDQF
eukprot:212569_1